MSANDNAMTRFLFAILQQKCLKDIDWNKVAHNPILAQEITNGHAARMRYSRFKAALLGLEPTRRKERPNSTNRPRVSKKKKDDSAKAKKDGPSTDDVNSETGGSNIKHERSTTEAPEGPSAMVKEERMFMGAPSPLEPPSHQQQQFGQRNLSTSAMSEMQSRLHMRLLTPCSDSDVLAATAAASQGFAHSPTSDLLHSDAASFDFNRDPGPSHHHRNPPGTVIDPISNQAAWHHHHHQQQQNPYSPFGLGVTMGYGTPTGGGGGALDAECYSSAFCDHQDHHHHHHTHPQHGGIVSPEELGLHNALMDHESGQVMVKHEEWDTRSQSYQ